jgi:hypothetical protein
MCSGKSTRKLFASQNITMIHHEDHESSWITLQSNSPESVADDSPCRSQCLPSPCGIKALGCWRQSWTPLCRHCGTEGRMFWECSGNPCWIYGWDMLSGEESWYMVERTDYNQQGEETWNHEDRTSIPSYGRIVRWIRMIYCSMVDFLL